ncbi:UDP-2,4-diacetamido-2,4,6-trideoxy-beta-L-altropyranose hydrolase [Endozoicomonas sp. G2_2]|nr:UDP-2,4-diacetamido-2,4,6-trideoxy-beta-L-altropyranose hydrolase [Endozoicomonas sp. G2_2]
MQIGTGHVMRCLTLADALNARGHSCHFICREHTGNLIERIRSQGCAVHALPDLSGHTVDNGDGAAHANWLGAPWRTDAQKTREILSTLDPAWLIVDHYALAARWENSVRSEVGRLLVIDDLADRAHDANILLDQNLGRDAQDYAGIVPSHCELLIGPSYALLRPEFAQLREDSYQRRPSRRLARLLVSMGGVDKDDATGKVLDVLRHCVLPPNTQIDVVMGRNAPWLEKVLLQANAMPWPTRVRVDTPDMARYMAEADLAIGAAGSTAWERCSAGLPSLIVLVAENQREGACALENSGAASVVGGIADITLKLPQMLEKLTAPETLSAMSKASSSITDGLGTARVVESMYRHKHAD